MEKEKEKFNFVSTSSVLDQKEVNDVVDYLFSSGMSYEDITKIGEHRGWFAIKKESDESKKN